MATKVYLTAKSPGTKLTGPLRGNWSEGDSHRNARGHQRYVFLLDADPTLGGKVNSGGGPYFGAEASGGTNQKVICGNNAIWVTKPLGTSGTLSGTVTFIMKVTCDDALLAGASAFYHVYAYVTNGDSLTLRTVAINNATDGTAWHYNPKWQSATFSISGSYFSGDRIVFEIGANAFAPTTPPGDIVVGMSWGTTDASNVTQADAVNGDTTTIYAAAWLQFSDDLTWQADPAPPVNDACADAMTIGSLPYNSAAIDTTESLDVDRAVWFSWTATSTARVFASTRGSNYLARIDVFEGCGGAAVFVTGGPGRVMWLGRSQSMATFNPSIGTQYVFKITALADGSYGAVQSNGSLQFQLAQYSPPQIDDLFVDCQHIVCFRGQNPVNWMSNFYGFTPTGAAIDYTLRPMDSFNNGPHTGERYYFTLFGEGGWVEILDLATLNVGESEIDFIFDTWDGNDNPSSIVFDHNGNILLGWYGNNYDTIGAPATGGSANIRMQSALNADAQSGAPFPQATSFAVAVENGGSEFAELANNNDTIFYTSAGVKIKRWSIANGQLSDFATLPTISNARPGARGLRLLPPDGNGVDGVLVTYGDRVLRVNGAGTVIQTYTPSPSNLAQDLDKIEITNDRLHFWVSDQLSCNLFKFSIASGSQVDRLDTQLPPGQLSGFSIYQGYRAGNGSPPVEPPNGGGGNGNGGGGESEPGDYTLVYDMKADRWFLDNYGVDVSSVAVHESKSKRASAGRAVLPAGTLGVNVHVWEPGAGVHDTLLARKNGTVAHYEHGAGDDGADIAYRIRTPNYDGGDPRKEKLFGDFALSFDAAGGNGITVQAAFNNFSHSRTEPAQGPIAAGVEERREYYFDINDGYGEMAKNMAIEITGADKVVPAPSVNWWSVSTIAKGDLTGKRATDWDDAGYFGAKWMQGVLIEADPWGGGKPEHWPGEVGPRTVRVEYDGGQLGATIEIQDTNGQGQTPHSFPEPFIAHLVRLVPTDEDDWTLYRWRWVWEPSPELAAYWITQPTTHDFPGYGHDERVLIPHMSIVDFDLIVTADGLSETYHIPSSNNVFVKTEVLLRPNKGKVYQYQLRSVDGTEGMRIFLKDVEIRSKPWGAPEPYRIIRPFGDLSREFGGARI